MKRAEAEKLLGGYATGTLTEAERRALFEAALADQELFDALADEEALRELLADPRVRRRLLAALSEGEAGLWERFLEWWRRPVAWGVAGSVAVAALLVVMLMPVYQTAKRPVVQQVAQGPVEMAKQAQPAAPPPQAAPPVRAAPAPRRAAERPRAQAAAVAEPRVAERAEEKQVVAEAEAVRTAPAGRLAAERQREQAEVKPKLEAAPGGVVGGVVAGIVAAAPQAASLEADARTLYYGPAAGWKEVSPTALRTRRAADVAAPSHGAVGAGCTSGAPCGAVGIRYAVSKLGANGQYAEVAPGAVFARGDVIRLSVEANQGGFLRLTRQDAAGMWTQVARVRVGPREPRMIPEEGLRLTGPEKLALEFSGEGRLAAPAGKPLVQKAAGEQAVYVVETGGAAQVRTEIEIVVR